MTTLPAEAATLPASPARLKRFLRNPLGMTAAVILLLIVLSALFAPLIAPYDPNQVSLGDALLPAGADHLLGTDASGRDQWSRLLWAGRTSLEAGLIMVVTAILVGVPSGLLAGYAAGWFDGLASWIANLLMSLPQILILVVIITSLGNGLYPTMITLGILSSPDLFRLTRSVVVNVRNELYIDAARVSGLSPARIVFRHVLLVVLGPVLVRSSLVFGLAIIVQSGLEFLGFGQSDRPSWGRMLSEAFQTFYRAPDLVYPPGVAIGLTAVCLVIVAAAAADTLGADRARRRRGRRGAVAPGTIAGPVVGDAVSDTAVPDTAGADVPEHPAGGAVVAPSVGVDGDVPEAAVLRVEGLTIAYPTQSGDDRVVVDGVSLHLERGEVLGIVGESGSGKSQTSFGILGLLPPGARIDADRLELSGMDLRSAGERELQGLRGSRMAYIPQEPLSNLDPSFTVGHQLVKPMVRKLKVSRAQARATAVELLDRVGIADPRRVMASYPHQLSGGMAQRVLIAGAVSCDPEIVIADEPTTALDVTVQAEVLDLLRGLQRERNMGMILVTHNLGVVADICDRVAVMRDGRIVEQAPVGRLFADPRHEYTRSLLAATLEGAPSRVERDRAGVSR
ncbi:dipeptide/oligopeptide/nickel ABC transporter permease/ATP-binding protein [Nakamurella flavida]|uniref:Dipeptide/oligopeptide/nickel ABC transporter permease/ATP-binding protein n=1 Tax=Nakamurella flavida TaxID=363630 RepID=A0A939C1X6_9ACTN|nr:dipeptide/oligopeptide/nickel ABC transporter permease/ATP-binding protein [Nakamurella flavida]MBM9478153.1 dipeptide/oligopeptide/nickel ABC transporter permease/ATP-binding protein [Nakamurella flavida]MDP9778625.1 peptide/nickel transport system permease protein [Nakamurella flavida]